MGGGDKCLRTLGGKPMLAGIAARAAKQVGPLVLNANGDPARFEAFGLPIAPDVIEGYAGPLAGILTGLDWTARNAADCEWLVSFATDAPFMPTDLAPRLLRAAKEKGAEMACASSGGRTHPVFGLWPVRLRDALAAAMQDEGMRKIDAWTARFDLVEVPFAVEEVDPFFNANRPEDLAEAERIMARLGAG